MKILALEAGVDDTFIVCNGDNVTRIDLTDAINFHKEKKAMATIILFGVPEKDIPRFGIAEYERDTGKIRSFLYQPSLEDAPSNLAHAGYVIMEPEVPKMIPYGKVKLERSVIEDLAKEGKLYGYIANPPYWLDIGTMDAYIQANKLMMTEMGIIPPP